MTSNTNEAPEFLTSEVFLEAVEYAVARTEPQRILDVNIKLASAAGDNYLGQIFRANVKYGPVTTAANDDGDGAKDESNLSIIVKVISNSDANDFLYYANVFLKEKIMYADILPRMHVLQRAQEKFGPRMYHSLKFPQGTLFFEDLNDTGYKMAETRESGLDEKHCILLLRHLAKFHATSMLLAQRDPNTMRAFHSGLVSEAMLRPDGLPLRYYMGEMAVGEALVRSWPGYEGIADKLLQFLANFRNNALASVAFDVNDINVLTHGDMWSNNVLFRYDQTTGEPSDATFVDFQMSRWGSFGLDLVYFLQTSVPFTLLRDGRDQLIRVYYDQLRTTLESLENYEGKIPTLEDVQRVIARRELYGLFTSFTILPLISLEKSESSDNTVDNLNDEEFALRKIQLSFSPKRVHDILKHSLKRFESLGVFDQII